VLCGVYAVIAVAALVATWTQNTAYLHAGIARFFADFLAGVKVTPASRSIGCDILFFFLAAAIFMVLEARKHGIRFVWVYILAGMFIDISVAFPLFLIARELRMGTSDRPRLRGRHDPARRARRRVRGIDRLGRRGDRQMSGGGESHGGRLTRGSN